ncbi:MAG: DUF4912 domain-containing protein [Spirochaetia bacterium]|nr:DUF4912 domain-containing protein [Spirochaetia bacterium]
MTRERLQVLSVSSLQKIAASQGILNFRDYLKDDLIDVIIEAFAEARIDHLTENNWTIISEEKKFDIFRDEVLPTPAYKTYQVPEKYNITRISLIMVDPLMAFVCWDLADEIMAEAEMIHDNALFLRVHETHLDTSESTFFDIPVQLSDDKWYINLPSHGSSYYIEIILNTSEGERSVCSSNKIESPLRITRDIQNNSKMFQDDFLILAGVYGFYDDESGSNSQKIVSFLDTGTIDREA